jgi:hypothetical protein
MRISRGYLVEFSVARALADPSPVRVEWGAFDVQAADRTGVEVKATGRLQSWTFKKPSTPTWSVKSVRTDRVWSEDGDQPMPATTGALVSSNSAGSNRARRRLYSFANAGQIVKFRPSGPTYHE